MLPAHLWAVLRRFNVLGLLALFTVMTLATPSAFGEPLSAITIDGSFADWASVPSYTDAALGELHTGTNMPDVHDTDGFDPSNSQDVPAAVSHVDVDLREFKFTHDENNLYAYFKSAGVIGRTQQRPAGGTQAQGRYYVIVTIDVDNNDSTGYWLHDGGYGPTSRGYDMNMELEFFDGKWNTGHYLSHDATSQGGEDQDILKLTKGQWNGNYESGPYTPGIVQPAEGNYDNYTQWVYGENDKVTLVKDKGPIVPGIITMALSPDGHELEFRAPFKGFLKNKAGEPNMALGKMLDISFSLEASGELALGRTWASDTGDPIMGYYLSAPVSVTDFNGDNLVDAADYVQWRKTNGSSADYDLWRYQFGESISGAASLSPSVPEPSSLLLCLAGIFATQLRRKRTR